MPLRKSYLIVIGLVTAVLLGCSPTTPLEPLVMPTAVPLPENDESIGTVEESEAPLVEPTKSADSTAVEPIVELESTPAELALRQALRATLPPRIERVPQPPIANESVPAVTGEVPEGILTAVYQTLTAQFGHSRDAMTLLRAESVVWNDGSLGCPQPGQFYTQAPVAGYWIEIAIGNERYDYRIVSVDNLRLCQQLLLQKQTQDTNR